MSTEYLRIWQSVAIDGIKKNLLQIGDSLGNCENCKEVGLDYKVVKTCPNCGTAFQYAIAKNASSAHSGRSGVIKKLVACRQDLTFIDYDDYKLLLGRSEAKKFFKD